MRVPCKRNARNNAMTFTAPDIIHRFVFYLQHSSSETGFLHRLQVETMELGPSVSETESSSI
jgi:hypothetical protein